MAESSLLFMLAPGGGPEQCCWVSWFPNRGVLEIGQPGEEPRNIRIATPPIDGHGAMALPIEVKSDGAEITVRASGKMVYRGPAPGVGARVGRELAVGTRSPPANGSKSGFRSLAIKGRPSSDRGPSIGALP